MARRADHTREELRQMILESGRMIIQNEGLQSLGARKIAREIGYTVGTLYNIFADYDDIVIHINGLTLDELNAFILREYTEAKSPNTSILRLFSIYTEFVNQNVNLWQALLDHNRNKDLKLPGWYRAKIRDLFQWVEKPTLKICNGHKRQAERASRILWAGVHGICMLNLTGKLASIDEDSVSDMVESLVVNFLKGLTHK